jgi:hypothetical protein
MLGQSALSTSNVTANSRIFIYEVTGLRQSDQTDRASYSVRNSSNTFIQVPYNRMNEEMRRITRLGGTIVNIQPLGTAAPSGTT